METERASFALIPAAGADSVAEAEVLIRKMREIREGQPIPGLADLLDGLSADYGSVISVDGEVTANGAFISVEEPELGPLNDILMATKDCSIAVFDIALSRLYNPRGSVDIEVVLGGDCTLPYLTAQLLDDLVRRPTWPDPDSPFLIVARDGEDFIQTYLQDDGYYDLEYRDGSFEKHYDFYTPDAGLVSDVMWAWTAQDSRWRTAVPWTRMELSE
jgi:hypothetical protein